MRLELLAVKEHGITIKGRPASTAGLSITRCYIKGKPQHKGYRVTHTSSARWVCGPFEYRQAQAIAAMLQAIDWTLPYGLLVKESDHAVATIGRVLAFVTGSPERAR